MNVFLIIFFHFRSTELLQSSVVLSMAAQPDVLSMAAQPEYQK